MTDGTSAQFGFSLLHVPLLKWWLPVVLVPLVLWGYERRRTLTARWRLAYVALLAVSVGGFGALDAARAWRNVVDPPEWDVQAFWVLARVGAAGADFYDPATVHRVAEPLQRAAVPLSASTEFTREVLDVGFLYPPPTMLMLAPFGHLGLREAAFAWYVMLAAALVGCIVSLRRIFFPDGGRLELAVVAALVLLLRATYTTFAFGQTAVVLLLALTLFWRRRNSAPAGLWLALGALVKPIFFFFLAYPVLRRRWRAVATFAAASAMLALLAVGVFGGDVVSAYFTTNPTHRVPPWLYTIDENQSMLSALLRIGRYDLEGGSPLAYPPFLVAATVMLGLTLALVRRLGDDWDDLGLAAMVPAALLLYPQSPEHYSMLELAPLLYLWRRREELRLDATIAIAYVSIIYALIRYRSGSLVVVANVAQWLVLVGLGARVLHASVPARRGRTEMAWP